MYKIVINSPSIFLTDIGPPFLASVFSRPNDWSSYSSYIWSSLGRLALNHESSRYLLFLCSNYGVVNPLGISTIFGDHLHNPDQRKVVHWFALKNSKLFLILFIIIQCSRPVSSGVYIVKSSYFILNYTQYFVLWLLYWYNGRIALIEF